MRQLRLFIMVGIVVVTASFLPESLDRWLKDQLARMVAPFQLFGQGLGELVGSQVELVWSLKNLADENVKLKAELDEVKARVINLRVVQQELKEFKAELTAPILGTDQPTVHASVIGRSPTSLVKSVTINRGQKDGLVSGLPVLAKGFLIGLLEEVRRNTATVELITSHRFVLPVKLVDSQTTGLLKGGLKGVVVEDIPLNAEVKKTDQIATEPFGELVPGALPIGEVVEVASPRSAIFQTVVVGTPVNFQTIRSVTILKTQKSDE